AGMPVGWHGGFGVYGCCWGSGTVGLGRVVVGSAAFSGVRPGLGGQGTQIVPFSNDTLSATQTLPAALDLFGDSVTMFKASSNGFISFDPALPSALHNVYGHLPSASAPNGTVAPYWDDLFAEVCVSTTAT